MHQDYIGRPKEALDTPVLIVDLDAMERNIDKMARTIIHDAGVRWRPHTKALKSPAITKKLLDAGATGVTCAKLGEAEVMAAAGITDILVANQVVGPQKVARLVELCRSADVIVAVDDIDNVDMIDRMARDAGVRVRAVVEVDAGMHRAGRLPGPDAVAFAQEVAGRQGIELVGLMAWEAHALNIGSLSDKTRAITTSLRKFIDTAEQCRRLGMAIEIVSCGGTGTYWITAFIPGVTEIQAGGGSFGDLLYTTRYHVPHECAITVLTTVSSRPTPYRIICDAGAKTMSRDFILPQPIGIRGVRSVGLSAEHGIIELESPTKVPKVGDRIEFTVGYSDTTTVLHDVIYGIRDGIVETVWPLTCRGKIQ